jgi:tetratricopeptide (TPR) repeat protein
MEETPERLRDLSISLGRIGDVASARGHLGDALRHYEEALQIAGKVNDTAADMNWTVWLAHLLGSHLARVSRHVDAFDVATRYLDHARSLESEAGDNANILDTCAAFWETRASAAEACGEIDAAMEAAAHADALRARITALPE